MRKLLGVLFAVALMLGAGEASAQRQAVPIVNHVDIVIDRGSAPPLSAQQVRQAIISAPAPRKWEFSDAGPGRLVATLVVRGKHTVVTDITYGPARYSIVYRDSTNMKYGPGPEGKGVIHPFYNQWVDELRDAIRTQLAKT